MTLIYFILILGITVFVHEFGHFICAKKYGIYVYEFSIGMGPKLFGFKRKNDETNYVIRLLPIGGYVQMAGEEIEKDENIPENKRFQSKSMGKKIITVTAGVIMNFLLAIILYTIIGFVIMFATDFIYLNLLEQALTKEDEAAEEMPEKHEKKILIKMPEEQKNIYDIFIKEIK